MKWRCVKFLMFLSLYISQACALDDWGGINIFLSFPQIQNDINNLTDKTRSEVIRNISLGYGLFEDTVIIKLNSVFTTSFKDIDYQNIAKNILHAATRAQYIVFDITDLNAAQLTKNQDKIYLIEKYFLIEKGSLKFGIIFSYDTADSDKNKITLNLLLQNKNSYLGIKGDIVAFVKDLSVKNNIENLNNKVDFLNLHGLEIDENNVDSLKNFLIKTTHLRGIDLSSTMLNNFTGTTSLNANKKILKPISDALKNITSISFLKISSNSLNPESSIILADPVKNFTNLVLIDLSYNRFGGKQTNLFLKALASQKNLTFIDLANNDFNVENSDDFVNVMRQKASIAYIDISYNFFGPEGVQKFFIASSHPLLQESLQVVKLRKNYYIHKGYARIHKSKFSPEFSRLFFADLGENYFYSEESTVSPETPSLPITLRYLYLDSNKMVPSRFESVSNILVNATRIEYLDISNNNLGDSTIHSLIKILSNSKTLAGINLSKNNFSASSMVLIAKALSTFSKINTLILSKNIMTSESFSILAEHFSKNRKLKELELSQVQMSDDDAVILASGLNAQTELSVLDVSFNNIDKKGLTAIMNSLKNKENFTTLKLDGNRVNCDDVTELFGAIKFKCI